MEHRLAGPLSIIVEINSNTRSVQRTADVLRLHHPQFPRTMRQASPVLMARRDSRLRALGAYMHDLTDKAHRHGEHAFDNAAESVKNLSMKW